ncbi:MAG: hypothetical protein H7Y11_09320 [Armatimonadetes bacterium]|nr:hypothetical protein [Anaerolineae bacterium]
MVEVVVYQDTNGGSPVDAKLVGRKTIDIQTTGTVTVTFDAPLSITERFLWVGFYLPVDFQFGADTSGTSNLTYWAWQPGTTFDLANLASASVFGPSNGAAPVNINLGGVAGIRAELITSGVTVSGTPAATPVSTAIGQIPGDPATSFTPMQAYPDCGGLLYDGDDIAITYQGSITIFCRVVATQLKPEAPTGYNREGALYDVYVFGVNSGSDPLPYPVTHCIKPPAAAIDRALVTLGQGAPRTWSVLPTVRFGEYICAELGYAGFVSYVIPK